MFVYKATKKDFLDDVDNEVLVNNIILGMEDIGADFSDSEKRSWINSLPEMAEVLRDDSIPSNCGIAIEYKIPRSNYRVDFMISGFDANEKEHIVIVELKQWSNDRVETVDGLDSLVKIKFGDEDKDVAHPSYQACFYKSFIKNFNIDVQDSHVELHPCVYAHNYLIDEKCVLKDSRYEDCVEKAPIFGKSDKDNLTKYIVKFINNDVEGGSSAIFDKLEDDDNWRPSCSVLNSLNEFGKSDKFMLTPEQKVIYENIKKICDESSSNNKNVVIVEANSGCGKTVLALKLLLELETSNKCFVTENTAPRNAIFNELKNSKCSQLLIKPFIRPVHAIKKDDITYYDTIICDEAHRILKEKEYDGTTFHTTTRITPIIEKSNCSVFFTDCKQPIADNNIGSAKNIETVANRIKENCELNIYSFNLESQFRCAGSDEYIAWVEYCLDMKEKDPDCSSINNYDFAIYKNPEDLERDIRKKNKEGKSRLVAGYCWPWEKDYRDDVKHLDIEIETEKDGKKWAKSWNKPLINDYSFVDDPDSINQVGSVYAVQGLELDYVGVIIGKDLTYNTDTEKLETNKSGRAYTDTSFLGIDNEKFVEDKKPDQIVREIIQNTYYILMTRGTKGCYVYCCDPNLAEHWSHLLGD